MQVFGLINYQDYILKTIAKSNYSRNALVLLLLCLVTSTVRLHLSLIISSIFIWNNNFDFIFPIFVTVFFSMISETLFKYVETHRPLYENIVDYFMENYTRDNFIRWKRYILAIICCYILLATFLITIDNNLIFTSTIQTICSFVICDFIENKLSPKWHNRLINCIVAPINNLLHRPYITPQFKTKQIIDDYTPLQKHPNVSTNSLKFVPFDPTIISNGMSNNDNIHGKSLRYIRRNHNAESSNNISTQKHSNNNINIIKQSGCIPSVDKYTNKLSHNNTMNCNVESSNNISTQKHSHNNNNNNIQLTCEANNGKHTNKSSHNNTMNCNIESSNNISTQKHYIINNTDTMYTIHGLYDHKHTDKLSHDDAMKSYAESSNNISTCENNNVEKVIQIPKKPPTPPLIRK